MRVTAQMAGGLPSVCDESGRRRCQHVQNRVIGGLGALVIVSMGLACSSKEKPAADSAAGVIAAAPQTTPPSPPVASAGPGGNAPMACMATMDSLRTQMRSASHMTDAELSLALPAHRRMVTTMLTHMSTHLQSMGASASAAYVTTADSVRADLDRFDTMSPAEVRRAMPAHDARISRLMQLHMTARGQHMTGGCSAGGCCCR